MTSKQREAARICRRLLIDRIGVERYELWFPTDHSISLSESEQGVSKLIVAAENEFSSQCQQRNFRAEIADIARRQFGDQAQVVFCVKSLPDQIPDSTQISDTAADSSPESEAPDSVAAATRELAADLPNAGIRSSSMAIPADKNCYNQHPVAPQSGDATQSATNSPSGTKQPADSILFEVHSQDTTATDTTATDSRQANRTQPRQAEPGQTEPRQTEPGQTQPRLTARRKQSVDDTGASVSRSGGPAGELKRRWETLDTFVSDSRNNVAAVSALRVVESIGEVSPMFLCGPTGSGKTHLLEGIYVAARNRLRAGRVMYMSSAQYTTQFLEHLNQRTMPMFRHRFQDLEVLLLDDIQFFENKRATRVELVQLIDNLARRGRQLVLTADRNLSELGFLGPELITRISSGLVCPIDYPSLEGRREIIDRAAQRRGLNLGESVIDLMAERISGDVRHVRGAMNRLHAYFCATGDEITVERARDWLADIFQNASRVPTLTEIEEAVCGMFGLDNRSLRSDRKHRAITQPRMLAMWLSRKYTRAALSEIGDYFGGRSHSTVLSAKNKVNGWMDKGQSVQTRNGEVSVEDAIRRIETRLHVG